MRCAWLIVCIALCGVSIAQAASSPADRAAVVRYFQGPNEPTAKDAVWTADNIFKVGVIDDGTLRDGYAMYVCENLAERGFSGTSVQIIDIEKLVASDQWVKLGEAHCR